MLDPIQKGAQYMKSLKKGYAILTVTALTAALAAGCGGTEKSTAGETPGASPTGTSAKPSAPVALNVTLTGTGLPSTDADVIKQTLDKKLGIDLTLAPLQTLDDYSKQVRLRISAGNYPDLFQVSYAEMKEYADKGLLLDLTPYYGKELKVAGDFVTSLSSELLKKASYNGKIYAIPRNGDAPFDAYWIRKDWLDKQGLKVPTTLEELLAVAKAFTENDPDGNGKKDTYGILGGEFSTFASVLGAYGVSNPFAGAFYKQGDKLVNAFYDSNMPLALGAIKTLIDANVVDPEIMTNKSNEIQQKAFQGKGGIVNYPWTGFAKDEFIAQIKTVNPKAEWITFDAPVGPAGQFDGAFDYDRPGRLLAIPKTLEKDKEKLRKIFDLINYVSSKEGNELVMYGIEGKHYTKQDGKYSLTDLMTKEGGYFTLYQFTGRPNESYLANKFPNQKDISAYAANTKRIRLLDSSVIPPEGFNKADADRYTKEELVKFVYGKRPLSEYPAFLKTLEETFKYKLYVDSAEKQLKEQGLLK
ncbi:ABC transporter substrate-binding protein [Paenibacillus contaminans]|uniref:ABC transporter substrate-binding protein n=2 Tax=Paenibacillus contaminans TaxID=450362 RepID=A0A329MVP8_9BACL|nr:ABC transporter substrate-binding protein [Paenibacillus contaminans]